MGVSMSLEQWWNGSGRGETQNTKIKTCPSVTLSTTNPTQTVKIFKLQSNGLKYEKFNYDNKL
jgi:hypothetical protein